MPLKALVVGDEEIPVDDVLRRAEKGDIKGPWTYELLSALLATVQDRGRRISTTTLTAKCPRSEYLKRTTDYTEEAAKLWASFRGTMFHGQLEQHAHPRSVAEARYWKDLGGDLGMLSGSPDLVDISAGLLYDYKFTKENPRYDYPWKDHIEQVQINRWLVEHADYVEERRDFEGCIPLFPLSERGHDLVAARIEEEPRAFLAGADTTENRIRFVPYEWQGCIVIYMDDKGPKPLTCTRSEEVIGKNSKPRKVRVPDVWADHRVYELVVKKYAERQEALEGDVLPDIPEGYEAWAHPLCGFCPVRQECVDRYIGRVIDDTLEHSRRAS